MRRLLLAVAASLAVLLLVEGALSLGAGRSLRHGGGLLGDADEGLYALHPDPLVGYALRPERELAIFDGTIRSDALGLRVTPDAPRSPDTLCVVVLGDSVAFGYGLDDHETLAAELQRLLASVRRAGDPPVACRTVAQPGWNHRNAVHFLLDHLDELDPDLVLYLPVPNDLEDTDGMDQDGFRRAAPDIAAADPWLHVGAPDVRAFQERVALGRTLQGTRLPQGPPGAAALVADLSAESRRRYDENALSIRTLVERIEARGGHVVLLHARAGEYYARLAARLPDLRSLPLFVRFPREMTLGFDPHPDARAQALMARWALGDLLAAGLLPGDAGRLPEVPAELAMLRAPALPPAEAAAWLAELDESQAEALLPVVDFRDGRGCGQVYGGLNADGSASSRLLVLVGPGPGRVPEGVAWIGEPPRPGQHRWLRVELAPLPGRPDLDPLEVGLEVDGTLIGAQVLHESVATGVWRLPDDLPRDRPFELRLIPARWVVVRDGEQSHVAACVPLLVEAL